MLEPNTETPLRGERPKPLTVTVATACALSGLGATFIWQAIRDGRLEVIRPSARRTLILYRSLEAFLSAPARKRGRPRKMVRP
jgi:hypothetical protein